MPSFITKEIILPKIPFWQKLVNPSSLILLPIMNLLCEKLFGAVAFALCWGNLAALHLTVSNDGGFDTSPLLYGLLWEVMYPSSWFWSISANEIPGCVPFW